MRWILPSNSARETAVAGGLRRASKFYVFLWRVREELFDEAFQEELAAAYEPRGQDPCPPAMLAMVTLLQRYTGLGDAGAVDQAENDQRWQLVLGTLGKERAAFGQGSLVRFRAKLIAHDLDKRLVDRTVELAKRTKLFGWKQLRVALDSSPLEGAGRVEDTWNLIGRAMAKVVAAVAKATDVSEEALIKGARLTVLSAASVKAALDIDWGDPEERHEALQQLVGEAERLDAWVMKTLQAKATKPPVSDALAILRRVVDQDLEPDPEGGGRRIREGVAHERVISVGDPEMRHGRKSKTKAINGYKRHIIIANRIILGAAVEPANRAEDVPTSRLLNDARRHGAVRVAYFDRGYLRAPEIAQMWRKGVELYSRAYRSADIGLFGKELFKINLEAGTVTCPAGNVAQIEPADIASFDPSDCRCCPLRKNCTSSQQRTVAIHRNEDMLMHFRQLQQSPHGRLRYRQRTEVEHRLGRIDAIQGSKARYKGTRKNELDLRRAAAIANLQEVDRLRRAG